MDLKQLIGSLSPEKRALLSKLLSPPPDPIAIVGVGCRFPGDVRDPDGYWRLLSGGVDAIREVPPDRWDIDAYYDPDPDKPGRMYTRWGGFIDRCDTFDADFFGITPREARSMDPQQRLLLEVACEAIESAGIAADALSGSRAGVFIGISTSGYARFQLSDLEQIDAYAASGTTSSIAANRISYLLDLRGPSVALDTACSTSLVAVHMACQSLRNRECDLALVGGVNLILSPEISVAFSKSRMMAPDGRCKTFDARADGYVRGEGCGVVVLRRLPDAEAAGNPIWALLRGTAVNQDGRTNGLTAPNGLAQQAVIREALRSAGLAPADISYVEAHGTGTSLGDPIEVEALGQVFARVPDGHRCALASVKTNMGHLEIAAGIAGLVKVVLALKHGVIPPHLHFEKLNPSISLEGTPFYIPIAPEPWEAPKGGKRRAGLSSFGFGGTNAHVVLEEAPPAPAAASAASATASPSPELLVLSARDERALGELAARYAAHLDAHPELRLADVCFTARAGRRAFDHRLAIVAGGAGELRGALGAFASGDTPKGAVAGRVLDEGRPEVAFLFTGQGAQYPGMGRELHDTQPVFRQAIERCDAILAPMLGRPLRSLLDPAPGDVPALEQTAYVQPVLFALEVALVELWASFGVKPGAVLGHSLGEYVAAHVAGVLGLEDALRLVVERGRLMQALPAGGAMAAVFADEARVAAAIAASGCELDIAGVNGQTEVIVSGRAEDIAALEQRFHGEGVRTSRLKVSHAFHSRLLDPMLDPFAGAAARLRFSPASLPIVSNLTGAFAAAGEVSSAGYFRRQLREPVRFAAGVRALRDAGYRVFLEIGPQPTLLGMVRRCLPDDACALAASLRKGRPADHQLLEAAGALFVHGTALDWAAVQPAQGRRLVPLPTYPFQEVRHWFEADAAPGAPRGGDGGRAGSPVAPAAEPASLGAASGVAANGAALAGGPPAAATELAASVLQAPAAERRPLLVAHVKRRVAGVAGLASPAQVDVRRGFFEQGLDSLMAVELQRRLQADTGVVLATTATFDHPTVEALASHLLDQLLARREDDAAAPAPAPASSEPIALVGVGCRLPGGVQDVESFWRLLRDGVDGIRELPEGRWDAEAFYDPDPDAPGKTYARAAGYLDGGVDTFDAAFFRISPREARSMDPQQRLLLEVAWEALESAGQPPDRLRGSRTGVYIGINTNDYQQLQIVGGDARHIDGYAATGTTASVAAGRLSFTLGLEGPAVALDTACSSSLVAVHLACQGLRAGECDLAIAGGVNLILAPSVSITMAKLRALSPDGRCKTFDASADGYGRGEGCGVVVLKRLSAAVRDGDPILAVVLGSAVNQDGASSGLTVPNGAAQRALVREALARAGVAPSEVDYVEAHGTGTPLGDSIEVQAIADVMGRGRAEGQRFWLGSVKTNLGHLEAAAGVAGLIKAALALKRAEIPPHLNLKTPNPQIPWDQLPVQVPTAPVPWPAGERRRRAGVSSFGFSGTNAHVVLEEAPPLEGDQGEGLVDQGEGLAGPALLPLSARSEAALREHARRCRALLRGEAGPRAPLPDLVYTAALRRQHHAHRLAVVGRSPEEMAERLDAYLAGGAAAGLRAGEATGELDGKAVFLFPGQGSQWLGMGRRLIEVDPVFRAAFERCDESVRGVVGWSPLAELAAAEEHARLGEIDVVQPLLFALEVALAARWRAWGVEPAAVVGHSMGEVAAAHVAGALSLDDASRIICLRSRLLRRVRGQGAMAVVGLTLAAARKALRGLEDRLSIAVSNGPSSTVLSGEPGALQALLSALQARNVFCRPVKVDVASHSPQMDALRDDLLEALAGLSPRRAEIPMLSTVTGEPVAGDELDAAYWARNLRDPVLFSGVVAGLAERGHGVFIEMSPHPILLSAVEEGLRHLGRPACLVPSCRRDEDEPTVLLESAGALYTAGYPLDWARVGPASGRCAALPSYPWQRQRYWLDGARPGASQGAHVPDDLRAAHPLLGVHLRSARPDGEHFWDLALSATAPRDVGEHRVGGIAAAPLALYIELALAAAAEAFGASSPWLEHLEVRAPLLFAGAAARRLQLIATPDGDGAARLELLAHGDDGAPGAVVAEGRLLLRPAEADAPPAPPEGGERLPDGVFDGALRRLGLELGDRYPRPAALLQHEGALVAELEAPAPGAGAASAVVPVPLLQSALLLALAAARGGAALEAVPLLPSGVDRLRVFAPLVGRVRVSARWRDVGAGGMAADVTIADADGRVLVQAEGVRFTPVHADTLRQATRERIAGWLYEVRWEPRPEPAPVAPRAGDDTRREAGRWLLFADEGGLGDALAAALEAEGDRCTLVTVADRSGPVDERRWTLDPADPAAFVRLAREHFGPGATACRGVVHLWSLDGREDEPSAASIERRQLRGALSALHLAQALGREHRGRPPRLWVVTRGVEPVEGPAADLDVAHAPLWGLGRAIALEQPDLWGGIIDLAPRGEPGEASALVQEIRGTGDEDQLAFRGGRCFVPRLVRAPDIPPRPEGFAWRGDATYLITGGLGALGLKLAVWMVERGVRRLVLVGRSPFPERASWDALAADPAHGQKIALLRAMEAQGAEVHLARADVADEEQMAAVLRDIAGSGRPLRGVVHAAGMFERQDLYTVDARSFARVLRPKVAGTWVLHALTRDIELDFFLMYSSAASVWGSAEAAHYLAANHFQDVVACFRRARGLPALGINWGWWEDGGMVTPEVLAYFAAVGLFVIPTRDGIDAAGLLLGGDVANKTVASVDWGRFKPIYEARRRRHLLDRLVDAGDAHLEASSDRGRLAREIEATAEEARWEWLIAFVQREAGEVLGVDPAQPIEPRQGFFQLGMDSVMSVQLKMRIEKALGQSLPSTFAFEHPTVESMSRYLGEEHLGVAPPAPRAREDAAAAAGAELDGLSEDDLLSMLAAEVSGAGEVEAV